MTEFTYEALNEDESLTSGTITAESVSAAVIKLESQGLQVISIQRVDSALSGVRQDGGCDATIARVIADDQEVLCQRVAEVLEKRHVLAPALAAFAEELPSGHTRRELESLVSQLQTNASAEDICDSDDRAASWLLLLGSGSNSHRLLCDLLDEATRESESRLQRHQAFLYPLFVLLGSFVILIILCVTVVPIFADIFDDFAFELPAMTNRIVDLSDLILRNPIGFGVGTIAIFGGVYAVLRLIRIWGLPGRTGSWLTSGSSTQLTAMARLTRRLAEALEAGLDLPAAFRLAGRAEGRGATSRLAMRVAREAGHEDFDLIRSAAVRNLPATVAYALQAGPGNQPSIPLLRQLSDAYSTRVRNRCNWSTGYIAHFAIIGAGIVVAFVVVALFLPLVSLVNGLTG